VVFAGFRPEPALGLYTPYTLYALYTLCNISKSNTLSFMFMLVFRVTDFSESLRPCTGRTGRTGRTASSSPHLLACPSVAGVAKRNTKPSGVALSACSFLICPTPNGSSKTGRLEKFRACCGIGTIVGIDAITAIWYREWWEIEPRGGLPRARE
jgi:hypothetical protein